MSTTHDPVQLETLDIIQDGSQYYKTTMDEKTGAARAYAGFDANSTVISSVLPGTDPSVQSGLNLTQTYLGYYNGAEWTAYMNSDGDFYLGGADGQLQWNGTTLLLGGDSQLIFGTRLIPGGNLLAPDVRLWRATTTPATISGMGYWTDGSNPYGGDDVNSVINALNPFGKKDLIWECTSISGVEEAGGWTDNTFSIDKDLRYRYSGWVKRIGNNDGGIYFGPNDDPTQVSDLTTGESDSGNANPYFASGIELPNTAYWDTNPIANSDFELTTNWTDVNSPDSSNRSASDPHSGTYRWHIAVDPGHPNAGIMSDPFTLDGYTQYRLSIWIKSEISLTNRWQIYIDNGEERHWIKPTEFENNAFGWGTHTAQVLHFQTNERSTTWRIYILSADDTSTAGGLSIDDVSISNQLTINGNFEENYNSISAYTGWGPISGPPYASRSTSQKHSGSSSFLLQVDDAGQGVKTSKIQLAYGSADSAVEYKLIDSTADFSNISIGDTAIKHGSNTSTNISGIESSTTLLLEDDIFDAGTGGYVIASDLSYIKLMGGYQYRCSAWLYGDGILEWNGKVSDGTNDYNFLETDNTTTLVPSGIWTNYTLDFEAAGNSDDAYIEFTSVGVSGTLYIDDVTLQETPWYLLTGFNHPDDHTGTESWGSAYHYKTGYSPPNISFTDFKSMPTTTSQKYRLFFNDPGDFSQLQHQYSPAIHVVDGSEPPISTLLGNSADIGWNVEHTTSISKYLLSSPTIRGGNYAGGDYVQMDAYGIRGFGGGINTFTLDAVNGNVTVTDGTITGGVIQTATADQRMVMDGSTNRLNFYTDASPSTAVLYIDDDIDAYNKPGIRMDGVTSELTSITPGEVYCQNYTTLYGTFGAVHVNDTLGSLEFVGAEGRVYGSSGDTGAGNRIGVAGSALVTGTSNTCDVYGGKFDVGTQTSGDGFGIWVEVDNTGGTGNTWGAYIQNYASYGTMYTAYLEKSDASCIDIRLDDGTRTCDFVLDASGYLNITPSGDRIRLWEHSAVAGDYSDIWTNTDGELNIQPNGTGATQTGKMILWDAPGLSGVEMYSNNVGSFIVDPGGLGNVIFSATRTVGGTSAVLSATQTTQTDPFDIHSMRVSNSTDATGAQAGIVFNTASAFAGVYGEQASGDNDRMGLHFWTEHITATRTDKMSLSYDGDLNIIQGSIQQAGADIIDSSGNQTGTFRTRSYIQFGINGTNNGTDDYMHGVGSTDSATGAHYVIPYASTITSVALSANSGMAFLPGDSLIVDIQKVTGATSTSWSTANANLTFSSADSGDYYKMVTGQTDSLAAGDRIRVWLNFTLVDTIAVVDPILTICLLSE